jgi:hypothetical protein
VHVLRDTGFLPAIFTRTRAKLNFAPFPLQRVRGPTLAWVGADCAIRRALEPEGAVAVLLARRVSIEHVGSSGHATRGRALQRRFAALLGLAAGA